MLHFFLHREMKISKRNLKGGGIPPPTFTLLPSFPLLWKPPSIHLPHFSFSPLLDLVWSQWNSLSWGCPCSKSCSDMSPQEPPCQWQGPLELRPQCRLRGTVASAAGPLEASLGSKVFQNQSFGKCGFCGRALGTMVFAAGPSGAVLLAAGPWAPASGLVSGS